MRRGVGATRHPLEVKSQVRILPVRQNKKHMKKDELLTVFGTHDIRTLPECIMSLLFGDQEVRDDVFRELIRSHAGDLSYDWFQEVYEEELSTNLLRGQEVSLFNIGGSWHRSNCLGVSNRTPVYSHAGNSQIDRFQFYC